MQANEITDSLCQSPCQANQCYGLFNPPGDGSRNGYGRRFMLKTGLTVFALAGVLISSTVFGDETKDAPVASTDVPASSLSSPPNLRGGAAAQDSFAAQ